MEQEEQNKPQTAKNRFLNTIVTITGLATGEYSGIYLIIPSLATFVVWWVGKKYFSKEKDLFLPAFSFQAGHLIWHSLALILIGKLDASILYPVILVAGLSWLMIKPGLCPVLLLTTFEAFYLADNYVLFVGSEVGSIAHRALLVHIIWGVSAIFLMILSYCAFRQA